LQEKVLKGRTPETARPGSRLQSVDLGAERNVVNKMGRSPISAADLASHLMYPKVFAEFRAHRDTFGDVSVLPTHVYYYGMDAGEELTVTMEDGRQVVIHYLTATEANEQGFRRLFFEINGQPSSVRVLDRKLSKPERHVEKADRADPKHIAAPMPGLVTTVAVENGQKVERGDALFTMEAMKMETIVAAERDGTVKRVVVSAGMQVEAKDLLLELV
jgi:pyruvate carboxylase